ncbi:MAG: hypothetical protein P4L43_00630 [Syntrophobacteraceae bacterium]|nr:hypothetical protein [Syntrophobacteraceae bacterium]
MYIPVPREVVKKIASHTIAAVSLKNWLTRSREAAKKRRREEEKKRRREEEKKRRREEEKKRRRED